MTREINEFKSQVSRIAPKDGQQHNARSTRYRREFATKNVKRRTVQSILNEVFVPNAIHPLRHN